MLSLSNRSLSAICFFFFFCLEPDDLPVWSSLMDISNTELLDFLFLELPPDSLAWLGVSLSVSSSTPSSWSERLKIDPAGLLLIANTHQVVFHASSLSKLSHTHFTSARSTILLCLGSQQLPRVPWYGSYLILQDFTWDWLELFLGVLSSLCPDSLGGAVGETSKELPTSTVRAWVVLAMDASRAGTGGTAAAERPGITCWNTENVPGLWCSRLGARLSVS